MLRAPIVLCNNVMAYCDACPGSAWLKGHTSGNLFAKVPLSHRSDDDSRLLLVWSRLCRQGACCWDQRRQAPLLRPAVRPRPRSRSLCQWSSNRRSSRSFSRWDLKTPLTHPTVLGHVNCCSPMVLCDSASRHEARTLSRIAFAKSRLGCPKLILADAAHHQVSGMLKAIMLVLHA